MCVCVCVWGGGARAGGVGEREVCAGVLRAIVSGCLPAGGGGCLWPPHVVRGHSARRGEVEHHSRAKDNAVRVCGVSSSLNCFLEAGVSQRAAGVTVRPPPFLSDALSLLSQL